MNVSSWEWIRLPIDMLLDLMFESVEYQENINPVVGYLREMGISVHQNTLQKQDLEHYLEDMHELDAEQWGSELALIQVRRLMLNSHPIAYRIIQFICFSKTEDYNISLLY